MQFKRSYFSPIDKLIDDMKSAYAMHYAGVPLIDIYWFKTRLQNLPDSAELLKTPLERYFEYNQRPKLAAFLRPVLLGWIGATDHSPALSVLDLLNNKEGPFHSDAPNAYSLGYRRPISESVINPLTEHLRQQSVQFRLGCEIERLIEDSEQGKITHVLSSQGEVIEADYFILALPIHVTQSLLSATAVQFSYRYVLSHGFQFHFATLPDILRDKTVGIVIDSPWGLSYHLTQPEPNGLYCLSVTATDLNIAAGTAFNKPLLACTPQQIEQATARPSFSPIAHRSPPPDIRVFMSGLACIGRKNTPMRQRRIDSSALLSSAKTVWRTAGWLITHSPTPMPIAKFLSRSIATKTSFWPGNI